MADVERAARILLDGGVVGFPTETVYGLGAVATDEAAVLKIFAIKGRPRSRALIVLLRDRAAMDDWAIDVPDYATTLAEHFWPGPLTLVLPRHPRVLGVITGGQPTVAVRIEGHPVAAELMAELHKQAGRPLGLAAPSANRFGEPPATSAQAVIEGLGTAEQGGPAMVLDGGPSPGSIPSTILSCVGDHPRLLRRGSTTPEAIEDVIGRWVDR